MEFHEVASIFPMMGEVELQGLASDIALNGLREPIWIHDERIIDGRNRFRACERAQVAPLFQQWDGKGSLTAFVVSLNLHRRHLNDSQRSMIAARLANLGNGQRASEISEAVTQPQAAEMLNVSTDSLGYARKVQRQGTPELNQAVDSGTLAVSAAVEVATLPAEQQRGVVARGEKEVIRKAKEIRERKAEENAERRREIASQQVIVPSDKYSTLVVDPPWPMEKIARDVRPNQVGFDYPTMSYEDLMKFPLPNLAADNSLLYLWTTHKHLPFSFRLAEAWGFRYVCTMVWHKAGGYQPFGLPQYNCEFVLLCRKGNIPFIETKAFPCCFEAQRREHSRKPDEFFDLLSRVSPGPKIDVFSREEREGWRTFGLEAGKFGGDVK